MAREIFAIYNKDTGFIEGGAGRLDRDWDATNPDGSTMLERIPDFVAGGLNRDVVYLPDQDLPDPERHKIIDGEIVDLTAQDLIDIEATKSPTLEDRVVELEKKIPEPI